MQQLLSRLIYVWFPASKTSAFLAANWALPKPQRLVSASPRSPSPELRPRLLQKSLPSQQLPVPQFPPPGTREQSPPCCFEASRGLKVYSLYSYASPQLVPATAPRSHSPRRVGLHQEPGDGQSRAGWASPSPGQGTGRSEAPDSLVKPSPCLSVSLPPLETPWQPWESKARAVRSPP